MKRVSIIVPTYKRNRYITRAIDSILAQDYPEMEIIVIDDNGEGSVDQLSTEKILKKYIDNDDIKYIKNTKNVGGAISRNNGILASTGYYITFLDDDDEYLPGKITIQVQAMEKNGWDLCVMDGETYNNKGERLSQKTQPIENGMTQDEILKAHLTKHITGTNVFMFTREAVFKIGMFDHISAGQEFMIMQKSITNNLKIGVIHDVYVHFHMDGQERISTRLSKIEGLELVYQEKKKYFNLLTTDEKAYINSKHHGTLFYMYYTNGKFGRAMLELVKAFFCSPKYTWETYQERKGKLKYKN